MSKKIPVIIDADTGVDDALALVLACASDKLDILAVTAVAGNTSLEHSTRNTLNVLHLLGRDDIPVAAGADRPLSRDLMKASGVHGFTGLRGYTFEQNNTQALVKDKAWDLMRSILAASEEKVTIIAIGPMTNVAHLLEKYPEVKGRIERVVFMGTSYHDGNPTPVATFNVLVDPEAFRKVLFSGVELYACPLETTRKLFISEEEKEKLRQISGPAAKLAYGVLGGYGRATEEELALIAAADDEEYFEEKRQKASLSSHSLHDPATVAFVCAPELFSYKKYYCDVECKGELTTGFTLIDMANYYGKTEEERNLYYLESSERERFIQLFFEAVESYSK